MQPMKMVNMSMDINQMSMQMGNMSMTMGGGKTSTSTKRFCSQCGQEAKISDRFCSSCGHKLDKTPLEAVAKCALLSIDSTMKSNISVGPPINLVMYETDSFEIRNKLELRLGAPYIAKIRKLWEKSVRQAFESMPDIEWELESSELEEDILID